MNPKHVNNGNCSKCKQIMNTFPGLDPRLVQWFEAFQKLHPDGHISFAGRGKADQEAAFNSGHSKAHFGQSAHNYNMAIDLFRITPAAGASWDAVWFRNVVGPCVALNHELYWGGHFKDIVDLPHVEIKNWEELVKNGQGKLLS